MCGEQHNYITEESSAIHKNSHNVAYCYIAYQCLWLKAYYAEEWWAATMSHCHPDRLIRYMTVARGDNVNFGSIDIRRMTTYFDARDKNITIGLMSLKKVGKSLCDKFADQLSDPMNDYTSIDDFIEKKGKNKTVMERLIKLGAFKHLHPNLRATWIYYQYKYCSGKEITALRKDIRGKLLLEQGWDDNSISAEIKRQTEEYKELYPNRTKIPIKILNFKPTPKDGPDEVMALFDDDYDLNEILEFEKEFLGYYWHSPADLYKTSDKATIEMAKRTGILQGVITDLKEAKTRNDDPMLKLFINDGKTECLLILWDSDMLLQPRSLIKIDSGIEADVKYDEKRGSFTLQRGTRIRKLWTKKGWKEAQEKDYQEVDD